MPNHAGSFFTEQWNSSLTWNSKPVEILLALLCAVRGYLLAPWDQFAFSPALYQLTAKIPQPLWGALGLGLGVALFLRALCDESEAFLRFRCALCGAIMLHWVVVATLFFLSNPRSLAGADRAVLAFGAFWCTANLAARHAGLQARQGLARDRLARDRLEAPDKEASCKTN